MGLCNAKPTHVVELKTDHLPSHSGSTAGDKEESLRSAWTEEDGRTLAGHLTRTHEGEDSLRLEDEYDNSQSKVLGTGMSGSVATVRNKRSGKEYALKTVNVQTVGAQGLADLRKEIDAMRRLDHPNICKLYETFEDVSTFLFMSACVHCNRSLCCCCSLSLLRARATQMLLARHADRAAAVLRGLRRATRSTCFSSCAPVVSWSHALSTSRAA